LLFFYLKYHGFIEHRISSLVAASEHSGFTRQLVIMENGDVLLVTMNCLGRNAMVVRNTVEQLAASGIRVHCQAHGGEDLTSPVLKMTMQIISVVAEFDKDLLIENTHASIARARV